MTIINRELNAESETMAAELSPRRNAPRVWRLVALCLAPLAVLALALVVWANWPAATPLPPIPEVDLAGADPEIADAVRAAREGVEHSPHSAKAWGHLAMVLHAHALDDAADVCFSVAGNLDKKNWTWPYLQANLHHDGPGGPESAEPLFKRAALLSPDSSVIKIRIADMLLEQGRLDEAKQEYLTALTADPTDAYALLGLGSVAVARGQYRDALRFLQPIAEDGLVQRRSCALLAIVREKLGERDAAERERRRLVSLPEDKPHPNDALRQVVDLRVGLHVRLEQAQKLRNQNRIGEACAVLQEAVERHPDSDEAWANLGIALQHTNDSAGAEKAMQRSIALSPRSIEYRYSLGMLQLLSQRYRDAADTFRSVLELRPTFGPAHFGLGECLQSLGDSRGAAEEFQETLRYLPDHELARQRLERLNQTP